MRPIINSEKRISQVTLSSSLMGVVANNKIVDCVQDPNLALASNVAPGTIVKAVYVEIWLLGAGQQPTTFTAMIYKTNSNAGSIDATEMTDVNAYTNKKNIFEMHQGIVGDANANPTPVFRNWIKIPKGKQRFGLGDVLRFSVKSITEDTEFCGLFIFKVYT